jgi:hypothetical protein
VAATITSAGLLAAANDLATAFDHGWGSAELQLKLFGNDFYPDVNSTSPSAYTEATFTGYGEYNFDASDSSSPFYASGLGQTQLAGSVITWTCTGAGQTIYGYYLYVPEFNTVWAAERFTTPQNVIPGTSLSLQLIAQFGQG